MDLEKQIARDLAKKAMEDIRAQLDRAYELSKMGPSGTYRELHIQLLTQLFDFTISGMVRTTTVSAPLFLGMTRQLYEFHAARRQERVKERLERKSSEEASCLPCRCSASLGSCRPLESPLCPASPFRWRYDRDEAMAELRVMAANDLVDAASRERPRAPKRDK